VRGPAATRAADRSVLGPAPTLREVSRAFPRGERAACSAGKGLLGRGIGRREIVLGVTRWQARAVVGALLGAGGEPGSSTSGGFHAWGEVVRW